MPSAPGLARSGRVVDAALALGLDVRTVPPLTDLLDGTRRRLSRCAGSGSRTCSAARSSPTTSPGSTEIVRDRDRHDHRRGRFDRLRARPPGLRPRSAPAGPGRPRREPALPAPARARGAARTTARAAASSRPSWPTSPTAAAMDQLISAEAPSVIFHAAAYKHVPMMEEHPSDAMHVNVGGTQAVLDAAAARGRRAVRARLDRQGRPAVERHGRQQARRRDARRRRRPAHRPAVRLGPLRQRPGLDRQRRADLPGAARERRAADHHRTRT